MMSKELEALEKLCDIALCDCSTNELNRIANYKNIIETALKDYEALKLKGDEIKEYKNFTFKQFMQERKQLKALEIIKEKRVILVYILKSENNEEYNRQLRQTTFRKDYEKNKLTQKEFDLLKEVLL